MHDSLEPDPHVARLHEASSTPISAIAGDEFRGMAGSDNIQNHLAPDTVAYSSSSFSPPYQTVTATKEPFHNDIQTLSMPVRMLTTVPQQHPFQNVFLIDKSYLLWMLIPLNAFPTWEGFNFGYTWAGMFNLGMC